MRGLADYTDYLVIVSGHSDRQVMAIGEHIEEVIHKEKGPRTIGREGYEQGLWVLVDFGEVVVHIFHDSQRQLFDLEHLWAKAPRVVWNPEKPLATFFEPAPVIQPAAGMRHAR